GGRRPRTSGMARGRSCSAVCRPIGTVRGVIDLEEAQGYVLDRCRPLPTRRVPTRAAVGAVLAGPVVSGEDVPPFANSAVDGYAIRAADVVAAPVELDVVDEVAAGATSTQIVGAGQAIRIMTGAPMPAGADAVVMVEVTERLDGGSRVLVRESVPRGSAVRDAGEDVRVGTALFGPGVVVGPTVAAVLASINA